MKTNPLLLGNKKLHSAVNLTFDEGVIKTRPGFCYNFTGAIGQFQGASEYRPAQGISNGRFADNVQGIAVLVDGRLWFNCEPTDTCQTCGEVHLFQAENYLILQGENTCWWDGETVTKSPGLNELDWREIETPVVHLEEEIPVAQATECDTQTGESNILVRFITVNADTEAIVGNVYIKLTHNNNFAFEGVTNVNGIYELKPTPRTYVYSATKTGFYPVEDVELPVTGEAGQYVYDVCMPPAITLNGEMVVTVRLQPIPVEPPPDNCELTAVAISDAELTDSCVLTITNTGDEAVTITAIEGIIEGGVYDFLIFEEGGLASVAGALPATLAPGEYTEGTFTITGEDIRLTPITITNSCGDPFIATVQTPE